MSDQNPPQPSGGFSTNPKEAKAQAKAQQAHAKSLRPWYKKKRFMIPLALLVVIVLATAAGGGGDDDTDTASNPVDQGAGATESSSGEGSETTEGGDGEETLFPGRPDAQGEDQERNFGEGAELSGYTATVVNGAFQQSLSDFEEAGYVVIDVTIENRDDAAQSYNLFDWRLQTPNGQVIDPTFTTGDMLQSGDLVGGGNVAGRVVFEVGATKGDFFVVYKPDPFDGARGIWKVPVA